MPELDRRDFLKLVGAGAGAAAAAGCSERVTKLIPYVIQPETITPGIPVYYASTCRECPAACGVHVKTREGRPIKLEGNPAHPVNKGALCARGQASIGRTYHPDRFAGPLQRGSDGKLSPIAWDQALDVLAGKLRESAAQTWLLGADRGPTGNEVLARFVSAVGLGGRIVYEPFAPESLRAATAAVFGIDTEPLFDLSKADLVISFGGDVLETGSSPTEHARQLAEARDVATKERGGARFVYVGPRLSMTAGNADEWVVAKPGTEGILALALAKAAIAAGAGAEGGHGALASLAGGLDPATAAARTGVDAKTIERLGAALAKAKAPLALPPSTGLTSARGVATAGAVLVLNQVLGAVGNTVQIPAGSGTKTTSYKDLLALVDAMKSGKVSVLLVHDADPLYSMPASSGFAEALAKVPFVVSFASSIDETTNAAHLVLPDSTPLESWGDASPRPGVRSLLQPTLAGLFDVRSIFDVLLDAGRKLGAEVAAKLPSGDFRSILEAAWSDTAWRDALARGGVFAETAPTGAPGLAAGVAKLEVAEPRLDGDGPFTLLAHPSPMLSDGRGANLPWLQELPDPVAKITWQSWAELGQEAADKLGLVTGDVVVVETPTGRAELPAWVRGGLRDDVVAIATGQGHGVGRYASRENDGQPGEVRGVNVLSLLPTLTDEAGGRAWLCTKAKVTPAGRKERIAFSQASDNKRQRELGETVSLAALLGEGGHGEAAEGEGVGEGSAGEHEFIVPYNAVDDAAATALHRWGMSIDLDRCTGCSACVAACYVENNVPVVGEEQVIRGRLQAWLRIERYVTEGELDYRGGRPARSSHESLGNVDVRYSPMLCQQCGSAPCEPVCPVIATYHNPEGLNGMVYNRCIGTRYCANNCPYKVRRFNWYDYNLKNFPEPLPLMLNPDVTVRGQGVMEKCTFCVQRIELARQKAKNERRAIADGEVTTACAQACPTQAIHFGNLKDAASVVAKKSADAKRGYHALQELNTRPAITYLAKVTRGSVEG
ncbi:MAG TPA: molybdopterin-dependent oxidoreductase [Myxococcota bacterium]|jgi:molybdopterin-containing oxidoreductase family iron-sulfur binding subunit|nr:molybdopterin-dependent oxidoreductase [Myxococcota bacterium]